MTHRNTFVQLLVLIAIAAFAIALIVPAVDRAREQASLTACKDNLRKVGIALTFYARACGSSLPVSPTLENPHVELTACLSAGKFVDDPKDFYCPAQRRPDLSYSELNFRAGVIGYYYYSAARASDDPALSKFLRHELAWPRELNLSMSPGSWVMSDIWVSSLPTAHSAYKKGVNYLMLDGSVGFLAESPRHEFH